MSLPEPNPITDSAEERLWNHIANSKQGGDPVGAAFCAAHPATDPELRGLLSLADAVQDTLRRDDVTLENAQIARNRLAAAIAAETPLSRPAPALRSFPVPMTRLVGRRVYPAYAVALLMLLAALAGAATAWNVAQRSSAAKGGSARCPNEMEYFQRVYSHITSKTDAPTSTPSPVSASTSTVPASKLAPASAEAIRRCR